MVSRVISISSEQSSVKRKLREINNDIRTKEAIIEKVNEYLFEDDLKDFAEDKDIIRGFFAGKSLEQIVKEEEFNLLSIEELRPYFIQLQEILEEIREEGEATLEDLKGKKELKHPERESWYKRIYEEIEDLFKEQNTTEPTWMPSIPSMNFGRPPRTNTEYKEKKKELGHLEGEVTILRTQKEEQGRILKEFGNPKYVMSGLVVLAYASAVGMIYPSTLLPYPIDNTYDDALTKWWILSLFFSHILAIFTYLFVAMKRLGSIEEN